MAVAQPLDRVTLALNWKAQPELGGFFQALADGTYRDHGLEVTIKSGGPMVNNRPLLAFEQVEFLIATNLLQPFDAVKQGIPTRAVAAIFQRDPQCLLAHPDADYRSWADLREAPLFMGNTGRQSFFRWLTTAHGFSRGKLRPYNHNLAPFLADRTAVMQGYATAEPKRIEEAYGRAPAIFLLADQGWSSYSTLIETRQSLIDERPELVQRFVSASIAGWRRYLAADYEPAAANALIQRGNPSLTDAQIAFSRRAMRELQLFEGLDGVEPAPQPGEIRLPRVRAFYDEMVAAGMYAADELDPAAAVALQFTAGPATPPSGG